MRKLSIIGVLICTLLLILPSKEAQMAEDDIILPANENVAETPLKTDNNDMSQDIPRVCGLSVVTCGVEEPKSETDIVKEISDEYGVDWKLIEAIIIHETGNRTSLAYKNKNNVGGLMGRNGLMYFDTTYDSYKFMINMMKKYYIDKGLNTIELIGAKYAPTSDPRDVDGLNSYWVKGVSAIYERLQ